MKIKKDYFCKGNLGANIWYFSLLDVLIAGEMETKTPEGQGFDVGKQSNSTLTAPYCFYEMAKAPLMLLPLR